MSTDELTGRLDALEAKLSTLAADVPAIHPEAYYTVREAAERIRCKDANLYQLIANKDLAVTRVGAGKRGLRVQGADLIAFLASRREGGPQPRMALKRLGL